MPDHETIKQSRWTRPFGSLLHHPGLWHLNRRSVAGGVAIGMLCGLIPGPLQMIGAALLSVLIRVNLPVAMLTTLYTNPFTIVPLYVLAYKLGAMVIGQHNGLPAAHFVLPEMSWNSWHTVMLDWVVSLGKPFAVGLPLLAISLSVAGYFVARLLWYLMVVWEWRERAARRRKTP